MSVQWRQQGPRRPKCSHLAVIWEIWDFISSCSHPFQPWLYHGFYWNKMGNSLLQLNSGNCNSGKRSSCTKWTVERCWTFVHADFCKQYSRQGELTGPVKNLFKLGKMWNPEKTSCYQPGIPESLFSISTFFKKNLLFLILLKL